MSKDDDDKLTTRLTLTRFEIVHLKDFAHNVDCGEADLERWDRMTQKLENALARIDNRTPRDMRTKRIKVEPDPQPTRRKIRLQLHNGTVIHTTGFTLYSTKKDKSKP